MARRLAGKQKRKNQQQMKIKDFNRNKKPRKNWKIPIDYNNKKKTHNNKTKICLNKYFSVNYTIYKNTNTKTI